LIYYASDRRQAVVGLRRALDEYVIDGRVIQHNARLVQSVLREPAFVQGATPTSFLATHYPDGFTGVVLTAAEREEWAVAAVLIGLARQELLGQAPLTGGGGDDDDNESAIIVRLGGQFGAAYRVTLVGNNKLSDFDDDATATVQALDNNKDEHGNAERSEPLPPIRTITVDSALQYEPTRYLATLSLDGHARTLQVLSDQPTGELRLQMYGAVTDVLLQSPREYELSRQYLRPPIAVDTQDLVLSPMPGLLISYAVTAGQTVEEGQELCIVESMKMQNMIRSPRRGVIAACVCNVGASLQVDQVIVTFETTT
jgi:propionyl-CoA carboxylase alpha chain